MTNKLPLYIRYPNSSWILFDDNNPSTKHQKIGLEQFIESGKDSLDVYIEHSLGGQFIVGYEKKVIKGNDTDKGNDTNKSNDTNKGNNTHKVIYSYINNKLETVQMMYSEPNYIAYINRITTPQ